MEKILFAKQPIYDNANNIYGYEILYRDSDSNQANITNPEVATAKLLVNYCTGVFESLQEPYVKIFINLTKNLIMSDSFITLFPDRVIFEIVETTQIDDEILIRISELKQQGFSFAIDDYTDDSQLKDILSLMDYIKIDLIDIEPHQVGQCFTKIKNSITSKDIPILIAEKVESEAMHVACQKAGFHLYQGYYYAKPDMVYGQSLESNKASLVQLISTLQQDDASIETIVALVQKDVQLAYQLLKIVNSPLCRLPKKIDSIQDAILYLGLKVVKQWALIMSLSSGDEANVRVFSLLLERARFCEVLAQEINNVDSECAFTVGLFSGIDIVMKADKEWLLQQIGLSLEVTEAILIGKGTLGDLLKLRLLSEEAKLDEIENLNLPAIKDYNDANIEATRWTNEIISLLPSK